MLGTCSHCGASIEDKETCGFYYRAEVIENGIHKWNELALRCKQCHWLYMVGRLANDSSFGTTASK